MICIAKRIIRQILHDKRSLALILVAPLLLTTLIALLLDDSNYRPTVYINSDNFPVQIKTALEDNPDIKVTADSNADATFSYDSTGITIYMKEYDSVKTSKITEALKNAAKSSIPSGANITTQFEYGNTSDSIFDNLAYMLIGVLSFMFVFILSGISFVRERTANTLERLMRTPVSNFEVVAGYSIGFGFFSIIQSVLLVLFTKFVLNVPFNGSIFNAIIVMMLIALTAVMLGILVSILSKSEFQVVQFIPIFVVPQIFFSGLIPVDTLPYHLNYVSKIMPLYYGGKALKEVMIYGDSFHSVMVDCIILLLIITFLFVTNTFSVKRYRRS